VLHAFFTPEAALHAFVGMTRKCGDRAKFPDVAGIVEVEGLDVRSVSPQLTCNKL
jgi:hypothetical protein